MSKKGWDYFLDLCASARDDILLTEVLELLLTHEEKASIETRCLIIKELLASKKSQRQMAEDLHVSIAKITRGSNELKRISKKLSKYLSERLGDEN